MRRVIKKMALLLIIFNYRESNKRLTRLSFPIMLGGNACEYNSN